jgi:putative endonuclease
MQKPDGEFVVYVLRSAKDGGFYVGITSDLDRRLREHAEGKTRSTVSRRPFALVYREAYSSRVDAAKRERFLKSGPGREFLKGMLGLVSPR